ncbi:hypothetical protein KOI40_08355 [Aestuariicella sp. G3-2]|uniref:RipA family octameric membrane protein n=1 Tax=Pseudomaricurvus albidus TaxID=2842452 RepID=UPI001C0E5412|nr:hypothetical protein [Aestuariicella albida]MBU3069830.1 hypothetical protein [Aestuariicella albida]
MPQNDYSQEQYKQDFFDEKRRKEALEHALDIRKFEIELYWKRAAYFWTFIGAAFAGFIAVQASAADNKQDLSVMLSCIGAVFSFAWVCVNRGSKQWQENWEKHVDMLEDGIIGPLYKVVLARRPPEGIKEISMHLVTGPSPLSVSKINQIISLYVTALWCCLLVYSLPPFKCEAGVNWFYCSLIVFSILACIFFLWLGRTYGGGFWHKATIRSTEINNG